MTKPHKSIQIFKNPWLEKFTHIHPLTPLVVWLPILSYLLWRSVAVHQLSTYGILGIGVLGFFVWTLMEYLLHRYIFHFQRESAWIQRFHFLIHGIHHLDPVDPTRLVMPPVVSLLLGVIHYSLFRFLMGPVWVDPFFSFFVMGYLCYDYIHFYVHHFKPTTRVGKYLKASHMLHHYSDQNSHWGVSSPLWDYIFGTLYSTRRSRSTASSSK